jgi:hypothetical protein
MIGERNVLRDERSEGGHAIACAMAIGIDYDQTGAPELDARNRIRPGAPPFAQRLCVRGGLLLPSFDARFLDPFLLGFVK